MAKLTRVIQKIFGSTASAGQLGKIGSLAAGSPVTTTDPVVMQALSNYLAGWFSCVEGGNSPAIEDMNALCFLYSRQLAYIFQQGIPEWEAGTTYFIGSLVNSNGTLYVSLTDNNLNNIITDTVNWSIHGKKIRNVSGNTTATLTDNYLRADATLGVFTITLPTLASSLGKTYTIKRVNTGANLVAIKGDGSETIDLVGEYDLTDDLDSVTIFNAGGGTWDVI